MVGAEDILDGGLREQLHILFEARKKGEKYTISGSATFVPAPVLPVNLPPGVVYAEIINETPKAVNLKVFLDTSAYKFDFPINNPSMLVWMPKFTVDKVDAKHWRIKNTKMWGENLDKSFAYFQSYLIKNYGFNWSDISAKLFKVVLLKK